MLLTTLVPAGMVKEDDVVWTFDSLLRVSNIPHSVFRMRQNICFLFGFVGRNLLTVYEPLKI